METQVFDTKPLLRPHQVEEAASEIKTMEAQLQNPGIEDKAEVHKRLNRVRKSIEAQTPRTPVDGAEEGRMVNRSNQLLAEILPGMCSMEEMRKAPPGAVDKHQKWEKRNKLKILEWKNLQLRLNPGESEVANLERHRPTASTLLMDNAFIQGKQFYIPAGVGSTVTFNDEQMAFLRAMNPEIAGMIGTLTNDQRSQVKQAITGEGIGLTPSPASVAGKKGAGLAKARRVLSAEHKRAMLEGAAKARAAKKAA